MLFYDFPARKTKDIFEDNRNSFSNYYKKARCDNLVFSFGSKHMYTKDFLPFQEVRAFARSLKLNNTREWVAYRMSGKKPDNIPASPGVSYKDQGWISWGDFLGTGRVDKKQKKFIPFQQARAYARSLHLGSYRQWETYCQSGERPEDIPSAPDEIYKDHWQGWRDWLGNEFSSFEEARQLVREMKLTSYAQFELYRRSGKIPANVPACPHRFYRIKGWISRADWLGINS